MLIVPSNFTDHPKKDKLLDLYPDHILIIKAIKLTADLGKSSVEYIEGILRNWFLEKGDNLYADWQVKVDAKKWGTEWGNANALT
ncbi:DnaD domain protein [Lysinibacillus cavernae]|uniref:DnaD domain protein n=1 Tax=Lysinibacillus cavernae TaxID=2666135 RepID=UPI0012D8FA98|nr:DnaD domain protein [Lysinibacillus cavernae]